MATSREIIAAFDTFDWPAQIEEANRLQRVAPTFYVQDLDHDREFWVSGYGEPASPSFANSYIYMGTKTNLLGLIRSPGYVGPETRELTLEEARRGIEMILDGRHDELVNLVSA